MKRKLIIIIIIGLVFCYCDINKKLNGKWELVTCNYHINEDFKFLQEVESELLERKLKNNFPKTLEKGDEIYFGEDQEIKINDSVSYFYYTSDTKLNIQHLDIVFPLNYHVNGDTLTFGRKIDQGTINWKLKRIRN